MFLAIMQFLSAHLQSSAGIKFSEVREELMKEEEFKAENEKLKPRYDLLSQIIDARAAQNIMQKELTLRVGTQKSNISRLESGTKIHLSISLEKW